MTDWTVRVQQTGTGFFFLSFLAMVFHKFSRQYKVEQYPKTTAPTVHVRQDGRESYVEQTRSQRWAAICVLLYGSIIARASSPPGASRRTYASEGKRLEPKGDILISPGINLLLKLKAVREGNSASSGQYKHKSFFCHEENSASSDRTIQTLTEDD